MISDVVDTDILLQTDDLNNTETNVYGLFLLAHKHSNIKACDFHKL